jgi:4-hydroxy-3-methylbut-2-enyl diphosphate reductase
MGAFATDPTEAGIYVCSADQSDYEEWSELARGEPLRRGTTRREVAQIDPETGSARGAFGFPHPGRMLTILTQPAKTLPEKSWAMKIILANPRGFCAGVNMAIECLERALDFFGPPLYVYHEIVHNKYVVDRFLRRGTVFVESLEDVPEGAPLLYSAHGVSPQLREQARHRRLIAIDATCPLVTKVHLEAIKYGRAGYTIVLIGHEGHDEVVGTMGEAPDRMVLVETAEDVDRLEIPDPSRVAYLTQTTLSVDDANVVIAALRKRFPKIANPPKDDICYATQNRQEAVRELAPRADLVLVLGSQNSSNSKRLAEIANSLGPHAHLIDGVSEIEEAWLEGVETVLITAGASAPEDVVHECIDYLQKRYGATIQEELVRDEDVHFPLPKSLRELLPASIAAEAEDG